MGRGDDTAVFEEFRPVLMGLAYRMFGSRADAEDAVQDTFIKWQQADKDQIESPASWLTAICTRRCIDVLRSAHKSRVEYVGAWLPEPLHTSSESDIAMPATSSLTTAFLLLLERLTPKERAAYLLHEIFEISYADVAKMLGIKQPTCRRLVYRARVNIGQAKTRHVTPVDKQEQLLAAFQQAIVSGDTGKLADLISEAVEIRHDSGGKVGAAVHVLQGKADVLEFIHRFLHRVWSRYRWVVSDLNGGRAIILRKQRKITAAVSFAYDENGNVTSIYILRNPDKLVGLRAKIDG